MAPRWKLRSIFTSAILCAATSSTVGQQPATIGGQILDALSHKPVSLAEIRLPGTALRVATDLSGRFALSPVPPGIYALEARRIGSSLWYPTAFGSPATRS